MEETIKCSLPVKLTEVEINVHARELAKISQELESTKNQKKEVTAQFGATEKRLEAQIHEHSTMINQGYEYRTVECQWAFNWDRGTKILWRMDAIEIVREEKMTDEDRQGRLPIDEGKSSVEVTTEGSEDVQEQPDPAEQATEQTTEEKVITDNIPESDCAPERNDAGVCIYVYDCTHATKTQLGCCKACERKDDCQDICEKANQ